jgi:hypothetical protein
MKDGVPPLSPPVEYSHSGPEALFNQYRGETKKLLALFADDAVKQLQEKLGVLTAGDFYKPADRERLMLEARIELAKKWAQSGLEVWATVLRGFDYESDQKEEEIFQKALQEIKVELNASRRVFREAEAKTEETRAFWDAEIQKLRAEGQAEADVLRSEGQLYKVTKIAEGDLLEETAKAEVVAAKNKIYTEVEGGDVYLAKKIAPVLATLQGGVVSGIDPYDIDAWIQKLIGDAASK